MNRLKFYINKYKIIVLIIIFLITIIGFIYIVSNNNNNKIEPQILQTENIEKIEISEEKIKKVKVDIKGYVKKPGVYELDENSRVIDVIKMAGGLIEKANTDYINLSKKIADEMIIIIYSNNDVEKFKETKKEIIYIEYECKCPDNINDSCISKDDIVNTNGIVEKNDTEEINLVSINTGTLEQLTTLRGIGESKAKAIIEYREANGDFKAIEDIMNVSGIGEAAYSKIKDYIKL